MTHARLALTLALVVPALAGCIGTAPSGGSLPGVDPRADPSAGLVEHLRNLSTPDPDVSVESAVLVHDRVTVEADVELDAWVVRPDTEDDVPVVLEVTPYWGGGNPREPKGYDALREHSFGHIADVLVPRGYAYGIVSVRGTGNSDGCFTQGGPSEARDTAEVVEHFAGQPWSNGQVGLIGVSYPGTTPQDVWVEAPDHLETIVPIAGISDMYKYNFVNGVPIQPQGFAFNTYYWALVGASPAGLAGGSQIGDPTSVPGAVAGEVCTEQADVQEGGASSTLDGNKDTYWQRRDFLAELRAAPNEDRASVFYIHGLEDWNVKPHNMEDWVPAIQRTDVPFKAWLGQWPHAWPEGADGCVQPGRACRDDWWTETLVGWFDRFLKDRETGVLDAPAVQVQDDDGRWRHERTWPPADTETRILHPASDGTLGPEPGSGEVSYHDHHGRPLGGLQADLGLQGPGRAVFVSEPLEEDLHLSGQPVFEANVTASGRRASLMLTLAEDTGGDLRSFNFAAQSLNHVDSLAEGQDDISGETQEVRVRFFPQDDVVHAGNRLVLLAAGNLLHDGEPGPLLQPVSDGSEITIDLDGARLELPVDRGLVFEDPQPYDLDG